MPRLAGVNHLNAVRALEKAGFRIARQSKHIVMTDELPRLDRIPTSQSQQCDRNGAIRSLQPALQESSDASLLSLTMTVDRRQMRARNRLVLDRQHENRMPPTQL